MVALRASRLVCSAMFWINSSTWPISTDEAPSLAMISRVCPAAVTATAAVADASWARSAISRMDAAISSVPVATSFTNDPACWTLATTDEVSRPAEVVRSTTLSAPRSTVAAATASRAALESIAVITSPVRVRVSLSATAMSLISSPAPVASRAVRSPSAASRSVDAASPRRREIVRAIASPSATATTTTRAMATSNMPRAESRVSAIVSTRAPASAATVRMNSP